MLGPKSVGAARVSPLRVSAGALAKLQVLLGDITRCQVDAIVNAANEALAGGGGVDGAIHAAAGPKLLQACLAVPEIQPGVRCPTGEARITSGYELAARFVVHTVGPIWYGGGRRERELLASCYRSALQLGLQYRLESLAFPAISTGVFGYPLEQACDVAVNELASLLENAAGLQRVLLVAFDTETERALQQALGRLSVS